MFRPQVDFLPVLSDVGEGVATDHGRVVSLVGMRGEGRLKVMCSPGDVSPGRILASILVMIKVRHVWTNGIGVVELLHEGTSRVGIGNLVWLLPRVVNNRIIMGRVENIPDRFEVKRGFEVRRGAVVGHVVGRRSAGGGSVRV